MFGDSIIWYLFLGGGGAGAAAVLAACDLLFAHRSRLGRSDRLAWTDELSRPLFARGYLAATVALVLGALCLLFELGRPERFLYVLALPTASVLTFGSYVLAATIVCAAALGGVALFGSARTPVVLVRALEWAALALGLATTAYTGVLLAQIGFVPLWGSPTCPHCSPARRFPWASPARWRRRCPMRAARRVFCARSRGPTAWSSQSKRLC